MPAQSLVPNATNPLGLDPMLLASAYYGSLAMETEAEQAGDPSEPDRAPALAAMGSLESYLYGNNAVDSGTVKSEPSPALPRRQQHCAPACLAACTPT